MSIVNYHSLPWLVLSNLAPREFQTRFVYYSSLHIAEHTEIYSFVMYAEHEYLVSDCTHTLLSGRENLSE